MKSESEAEIKSQRSKFEEEKRALIAQYEARIKDLEEKLAA
jgi:hypothetical protein